MIEICDVAPEWNQVGQRLEAGRSVVVNAPRFFGHRSFALSVQRRVGEAKVIRLNAGELAAGGRLDHDKVWTSARQQIGSKGIRYHKGGGRSACAAAVTEAVLACLEHLVILLPGGGRGREALHFDLVSLLHEVLGSLSGDETGRLAVCVLDDFSLHYYESWQVEHASFWDYFNERVHIGPLAPDALRERLAALGAGKPWSAAAVASSEEIHRLTGGHPGLVRELLLDLAERGGALPDSYWSLRAPRQLRASPVLESLRRALVEGPKSLALHARRYTEPQSVTDDFARPDLQILRQLGILNWVGPATAVLCGGLVRELVEEAADSPTGRVTVRPLGSTSGTAVLENAVPGEDDFVILHLSDLHLGSDYPFRLPGAVGLEARGRKSAAELLSRDLERMELAGRVDALIVSGDFACRGKMDEFRLARNVVRDLLNAAHLGRDKLLIVAGNHDVDQMPETQDRTVAETGVSRDNYATFREILDFGTDPTAELLAIPSRTGRTVLRVLALDSNYVEGKQAGGIGFVDPEAFSRAHALLRDNAAANPGKDLATWIVVHHHVLPVNTAEVRRALAGRVSVMGNAVEIFEFAAEHDVEVILHGHEHQPSITISRRWSHHEAIPEFHPVVVLGAGSFSAPASDLGPFRRNHYFVLVRRAGDLVVRSRGLAGSGLDFDKHRDLSIQR